MTTTRSYRKSPWISSNEATAMHPRMEVLFQGTLWTSLWWVTSLASWCFLIFIWESSRSRIHMSSRENPVHLSNYYCHGYRFWRGAYRFTAFQCVSIWQKCQKQYYSGLQPFPPWLTYNSCLHGLYYSLLIPSGLTILNIWRCPKIS